LQLLAAFKLQWVTIVRRVEPLVRMWSDSSICRFAEKPYKS